MRSWFRRAGSAVAVVAVVVTLCLVARSAGRAESAASSLTSGGEQPPFLVDARAILLQGFDAAAAARSVHSFGRQPSFFDGRTARYDTRVDQEHATGHMWTADAFVDFRRIGDDLYVTADNGFWSTQYDDVEYETTWSWYHVRRATADLGWQRFLFLATSLRLRPEQSVVGLDLEHARYAPGTTSRGRPTVAVEVPLEKKFGGGVLRVDLDAANPHYPLEIQGGPPGRHVGFDWNQPVEVTAPAGADELDDYFD